MHLSFSTIFRCSFLWLLGGNGCKRGDTYFHSTRTPVYIRDAQVPVIASVNPDNYALATCPRDTAFIGNSTLPKGGLGAFAARPIAKYTYIGPYLGYKHNDSLTAQVSRYAWALYTVPGNATFFIDAFDQRNSNWLRYINCAMNISQQNLAAFQYRENIFYETIRDIAAGEELLVYYGDQYAKKLGINTTQFIHQTYPTKFKK